ncbi:ROK family transcriptional regulator [Microbacterium aurantiacum]|uniref:ROK family transcriptional regulator n=1 Tax=Microbacterium aurantiacum TaxID=162393 RepID=UPI000C80F6AC|nr:ROK family transcriptional regulator [Microbacterium aurantiacum]
MTDPGVTESARALAREILIHGPISRSVLGQRLGLSAASLTRLSKPLIDAGLVVEGDDPSARTVGRPTKPLDVDVDARRFVGVKITGDEAVAVLTDLRANEKGTAAVVLEEHGPEYVADQVAVLVARLAGVPVDDVVPGIAGVGVSVGGNTVDRRVVTRGPFLGWRDVDLGRLLVDRLGVPVDIENDVVALTVAEQWFGAGRGIPNFAVVTIGAGVGYGLVVHDRVVVTADTGFGLGGHIPLDPEGPRCADGHRGCATSMLTIPSIEKLLGERLGRTVDYAEALELARVGEAAAVEVFARSGAALGRMLALISNFAMVNTIVIAGDGIGMWEIVEPAAREALRAGRDPEANAVELHVDRSGFDVWARGAAATAIQSAFEEFRLVG